jgi:hypothetical protein
MHKLSLDINSLI